MFKDAVYALHLSMGEQKGHKQELVISKRKPTISRQLLLRVRKEERDQGSKATLKKKTKQKKTLHCTKFAHVVVPRQSTALQIVTEKY